MILVAGSANLDFVTRLDRLPQPGETVLAGSYSTAAGGKGANQAVACARAGGQVAFLGALGRDAAAEVLLRSFEDSGVHSLCRRVDAPTGAAFVWVDAAGENSIAVASGANACLRPEHLPDLQAVQLLVLQLEIPLPTVLAYAQAARQAGVPVLLNAAPAQPLPDGLLTAVDILLVNQGELQALAGPGPQAVQLRRMQEAGPRSVVVTLGGQGCLAVDGPDLIRRPAHRTEVRDTTAAGDTFAGVLAASLAGSEPLPLAHALERATVASALTCTRQGAQPSLPWKDEIDAALAYRSNTLTG